MAATLDPSLYPASYRIPLLKGILRLLLPVGVFALSAVARIFTGRGPPLLFTVLLIVVVILALGSFVFARVTLYPDRIERKSWFGKKSMPRAAVSGLEIKGSLRTPALMSKIAGEYPFPLPIAVKTDAAWDAWMAVISDARPGFATGL